VDARGTLTGLGLALAVVRPPRVVAALGHSPVLARVHQPVRTVVQLRLPVHALPVPVAVRRVRHHFVLGLARVVLYVGRLRLLLANT